MTYRNLRKIKLLATFLTFALLITGCLDSKSSDTRDTSSESKTQSDIKKEDAPSEEDVSKGIKRFYSEEAVSKLVNIDGCQGGPSGDCRGKEVDSVRVLKMTDKKNGIPKKGPGPFAEDGDERDYWAVEVEIFGRCQGALNTNLECSGWEKFQTEGRYNIYQNDFGEWRAWYRF